MTRLANLRPAGRNYYWRFWLGLAVTVATLYLAFRQVSWDRLFYTLETLELGWILLGVALFCTNLLARAARWQILLASLGETRPTFTSVFGYLMVGYAANNILPMRTGEIARAYYAGREERIRKSGVLATIAVERTFDVLGLLVFVLILSFSLDLPPALRTGMYVVEAVALATILALLGLTFIDTGSPSPGRGWSWIAGRVCRGRIFNRVFRLARSFVIGLRGLRSTRVVLWTASLSMGAWLLVMCDAYLYMKAFGFDLPFLAAVFVVVVANLGTMIPSAPGAMGVAHLIFVLALGFWDVGRDAALGFAVLRHGIPYLLTTGLGLASLWIRGLTLPSVAGTSRYSPPAE